MIANVRRGQAGGRGVSPKCGAFENDADCRSRVDVHVVVVVLVLLLVVVAASVADVVVFVVFVDALFLVLLVE